VAHLVVPKENSSFAPIKGSALTTLVALMLAFATPANADTQPSQPDAPTATFTVSPATPVVGKDTVLDWTGSCPAGPCTLVWENEYADGPGGGNDVSWGTTDPLHVTFRVGETKYVHLAVTDSLGRVADARQTVNVAAALPPPDVDGGGVPDPPTATFTVSPATPVVGKDTVFDWTGSCPAGPCTLVWENEYADGPGGGNDILWGTTDPLHVTFRVGETKYVHLAVTDALGRIADGRQIVTVADAPPPPTPDADGDGVPDSSDNCPRDPGPASNNGCPVVTPPPDARAFPRLGMTHFKITSQADAQMLARWDWVITSGQDALATTLGYWATMRQANPNIKISAYIDGTESNCCQTNTTLACASPQQYDDPTIPTNAEWTDNWWLKNYDGTYPNFSGQTGRHVVNPTAFVPTNAAGERANEHLAAWVKRCYINGLNVDSVLVDMVSDSSLGVWPGWRLSSRLPNVDLDRNGVRDISEHGAQWVDDTWGAGVRDLMSKVRAAIGSGPILVGNNGIGFNSWANGMSMEAGPTDDNELNLFKGWQTNHFGTHYAIQQTSTSPSASQTDYRLMRHNLTAAMMVDAYFSYSDGANGNYSKLWWYDEYSVNPSTGQATGDASHKGYCGQPTGAAVENTTTKVWRREFDNCLVLSNTGSSSQTVNLGGTFRKINGTQDHTTNSGASVSSVTIPSFDGLILLR
jgi:hypothetical protein